MTGNASCSKTVSGVTLARDTDPATANTGSGPGGSGPAVKRFVDAYITIAPHEAFNNVGESHTFIVSVFQDEIYAAPRSWAERAYPKLIHYNKLDKGTHFAAWEQPKLFVDEMRAAFKSLRKST